MQGNLHVPTLCTPDVLTTDGEASLIPDDKSTIEWNPRLEKGRETQSMPARSTKKEYERLRKHA
jgi:hypothetical protein